MSESLANLQKGKTDIISREFTFNIAVTSLAAYGVKSATHDFTIPSGYKVLDGNFMYLGAGAYSDWLINIDFHISGTNTANLQFKSVNSGNISTTLTVHYQVRFVKD